MSGASSWSTGRCDAGSPRTEAPSGGKTEMHHVTVGDNILLTFQAQFADVARAGLAAALEVVVIGDRFGADEAALEVRMDHACRLRGARALGDGPGARLLRADGEERHEVQQVVADADQAIEPGLLEPDL